MTNLAERIQHADWKKEKHVLEEEEGYDPSDWQAALAKAWEWNDRIPLGILYRDDSLPSYEEQVPALREGPPLTARPVAKLSDEQVNGLLDEFG